MTAAIIPLKEPRSLAGLAAKLPSVFVPDEKTAERFFGFFTANIRNRNTRREYNQVDIDPEPPDVVMTFGFPGLTGMTVFSRPLGRQGMVAFLDTHADTISVENKWFDKHGFVIDMPTIAGGASGSPVVKLPIFGKLTLVGLISASNTNLGGGYAVAEPVSRIRELLDRLEAQNIAVVDPWYLATQEEAKRIGNTIPVCWLKPWFKPASAGK